jgi:hypothetical protein
VLIFLFLLGTFAFFRLAYNIEKSRDVSSILFLALLVTISCYYVIRSILWNFKGFEIVEFSGRVITIKYMIGKSYMIKKSEIMVEDIVSVRLEDNLNVGFWILNIFKRKYGRLIITTFYGKVFILGQNTTKQELQNLELVKSLVLLNEV